MNQNKEIIRIELSPEKIRKELNLFITEIVEINVENGVTADDPNLLCYTGFAKDIIDVVCDQLDKGTKHVFSRFLVEGCSVFEKMDSDKFFLELFNKHKDLVLKQNYVPAHIMEEFLKKGHFYPSTANSVIMRMAVAKFITGLYGKLLPEIKHEPA